ncbi:hypothetical protein CH370_09795 [Leptospira kmetyi]|nr:hypothetical protein CH370_09795 [Leptospira kmetyi]
MKKHVSIIIVLLNIAFIVFQILSSQYGLMFLFSSGFDFDIIRELLIPMILFIASLVSVFGIIFESSFGEAHGNILKGLIKFTIFGNVLFIAFVLWKIFEASLIKG